VTESRCPSGGLSVSATVARGRWPALLVKLTLELLANPYWLDKLERPTTPVLPRDDIEEIEPLRLTSVEEDAAFVIFLADGDRFIDGVVRIEPPDLNDIVSMSLTARSDRLSMGLTSVVSRELLIGIGGLIRGRLLRPVNVLSSRPLKASSRRLPSASTSSICVRMSLAVSRSSSFGRVSVIPKCGLEESAMIGDPGKADGGADDPDRFLPLVIERALEPAMLFEVSDRADPIGWNDCVRA